MKNHKELIENNKISFITQDGRKGLPQHAPYDFIYVGATIGIDICIAPMKKVIELRKSEADIVF